MGRIIRVFPDGDVWVAKKDGASRASGVFDAKQDALDEANRIAGNQGLTVVVHGRTGRIQRTRRPNRKEKDDCFITTACVRHHDLKDDCYELTTLRWFRDQHLTKTEYGAALIRGYYTMAPILVARLEASSNKGHLYRAILHRIRESCVAIENGQYEHATRVYAAVVIWLKTSLDSDGS